MNVRGPGPIAALNLRCLAVLAVVNPIGLVVAQLLSEPGDLLGNVTPQALYLIVVVWLVACVPVWLVGFPAGVLTAHLLRKVTREWVHVAVFALVGAVLSVTILGMLGLLRGELWFTAVGAAEGFVGAGVARWWSGRGQARRDREAEQLGAPLPWGRMTP